jgi:hypothetical protein
MQAGRPRSNVTLNFKQQARPFTKFFFFVKGLIPFCDVIESPLIVFDHIQNVRTQNTVKIF